MKKDLPAADTRKRVMIVTAFGGHFDQALALLPAYADCRVSLATYQSPLIPEDLHPGLARVHRVFKCSNRFDLKLLFSLLVDFFQFIRILMKERPHCLVSLGSEIAIPAFLAALLVSGARRVHLESAARIRSLSLSGKVLKRLSHRTYVQWASLAAAEKGTICRGRVY
jgi:UDP-N-acetylglucosamine:LPS N-acetylglucosamine transferase